MLAYDLADDSGALKIFVPGATFAPPQATTTMTIATTETKGGPGCSVTRGRA